MRDLTRVCVSEEALEPIPVDTEEGLCLGKEVQTKAGAQAAEFGTGGFRDGKERNHSLPLGNQQTMGSCV